MSFQMELNICQRKMDVNTLSKIMESFNEVFELKLFLFKIFM